MPYQHHVLFAAFDGLVVLAELTRLSHQDVRASMARRLTPLFASARLGSLLRHDEGDGGFGTRLSHAVARLLHITHTKIQLS